MIFFKICRPVFGYKEVATSAAKIIKCVSLILISLFAGNLYSATEEFRSSRLNLVSVVSTEDQSYAFLRGQKGKRLVVNQQDYTRLDGVGYKLKKVVGDEVFLLNEFGTTIHLIKEIEQKEKSLASSLPKKKYRNINLRLPKAENVSLAKSKLISKLTAFSPDIANIAKPYDIEFKRNFAGRPGVLISDFASQLQAIGISLKENDIVLSVNGVPANELDELTDVLTSGEKVYLVEYERNKKLAMMKVEFK